MKTLWLAGSFTLGAMIWGVARTLPPGSVERLALLGLGGGLVFWVWFVKSDTKIGGDRKNGSKS